MTADRNSDAVIDDILANARVFAVVGASNRPDRPSYGVMQSMIDRGYDVHPVNPALAGETVLGRKIYAALADVPAPVDVVDIFRRAPDALEAVRDAIQFKDRLGVKVVWMQLGIVNATAADEAEAAGLLAVMDRCPKIEWARQGR
jgi:uncharacterized protein